jgi:phenylalanyl-tRNA synthetase beta chain
MLHPGLALELDTPRNAFLFELELDRLGEGVLPRFTPISKFPAIRRDLAIVVDAEVPFQKVRDCVRTAASDLLRELLLFDVYRGEKIDSGRKSLALGLILQASSQTLTEKDVETTVRRVLERLRVDLGARLRD